MPTTAQAAVVNLRFQIFNFCKIITVFPEGSSKETTSNDEASIQVLNVNAVKEIYNLLDWMIENQKTLPDRDQVFQYAFAKLRTMPVVDKNGQSTRIVLKALAGILL